MEVPFTNIISSFLQLVNSIIEFGMTLPQTFGIPEVITIGNISIQTYQIFGLLLAFFVFAAMFETLPKLAKYIGILILFFLLLAIIGASV